MLRIARRICEEPGLEWSGIAKDVQFIDVIETACKLIPGYTLDCCSFAMGWKVAEKLAALGARRAIVCRAVLTMPESFDRDRIEASLGSHLRMAWTHLKFAVVATPERQISILTSANLSKNVSWEWYSLSDDPAIAEMLLGHLDELEGLGDKPYEWVGFYTDVYRRAMNGGIDEGECSLSELVERLSR